MCYQKIGIYTLSTITKISYTCYLLRI